MWPFLSLRCWLDVEFEFDDVAILHDVGLAL